VIAGPARRWRFGLVAFKTFKAEPGPDGRMRVVSYIPNPETGQMERRVSGK
jgi:hypothetical protein